MTDLRIRSRSRTGIELVVTDLDGTLWDADERIHDRTLEALRALEQARVPLLVATGRRLRSARARLSRDGLDLPIVALDGALGRAGERTFHHRTFGPGGVHRVLAAFTEAGLSPCLYVDDTDVDVVIGPTPSTHAAHLRMLDGCSRAGDLEEVVAGWGVHAMAVYGVTGAAEERLAALPAQLAGVVETQGGIDPYFGGRSLIVYPHGTTKWSGVQAFCADQGLDDGAVLAVGDGPNDLELLSGARIACVVSDGCDDALRLADRIIDPASLGGWAAVTELL